jgi:hypothetical protein
MRKLFLNMKILAYDKKEPIITQSIDATIVQRYFERIKTHKPTSSIMVIDSLDFGLDEKGSFASGGLYEYNEKFELVLKPTKRKPKLETENEEGN